MTSVRRRGALALAICLAVLAFARLGAAHDPFELTTAATVGPESMTLVVTMTRASAWMASGIVGDAKDFTPERFELYEPRLRAAALDLYAVSSGGQPLEARAASAGLNAENEIELRVVYPPPAPGRLRLHATCLSRLSEGHGNVVRLAQEHPETVIALEFLNASDPVLEADLPGEAPSMAAPAPHGASTAARFLQLGFHHILAGYDHLLFLGGLLLACRRLGSMLGAITCFTLAHSLTLALAVLERVPAFSSAWVEPLILASVIFAGVQSALLRDEPKHRYLLTFAFGLIHGLGFANALGELGPRGEAAGVATALVSFNVGVELGQLSIAAVALPLLLAVRKSPKGLVLVRALSLVITAIGAYWLLTSALPA